MIAGPCGQDFREPAPAPEPPTVYEVFADHIGGDPCGQDGYYEWKQARRLLKELRIHPAAAAKAGITSAQWTTAVLYMLAEADALDAKMAAEDRAAVQENWAEQREKLVEMGCSFRSHRRLPHLVDIIGPTGVRAIQVDLASGLIDSHESETFLYRGFDHHIVDNDIPRLVRSIERHRAERRAESDRLKALRAAYVWDQPMKAWIPKSGAGPALRWKKREGVYVEVGRD